MATLLTGYLTAGTRGALLEPYYQSNNEWGFFLQDDWKISKRLTLNIGVRYEIYTPDIEIRDRLVRHEVYVADFYEKRDRWSAAASRLETVLQKYPGPDDDKYLVMDGAIISEELGYADASFASYLMLPVFFNRLLLGYLKDDALKGLTDALADGHVVTSFAASERDAGSDITALAVSAANCRPRGNLSRQTGCG